MAEPLVYQYRLRTEKGAWLADVILRSDGFFATVSDWGNYAFRWTAPGREFRAFVVQLAGQGDYVCSKLETRDWWDGARTLKRIREHILTYRRDGTYSKEKAAEAWQSLADALGCWSGRDAKDCDEIGIDQFAVWCHDTELEMPYEFASYDYPPDVRGFCENVMPALATAIREELLAAAQALALQHEREAWESEGGAVHG
ncbi:hypothetical protein D7V80_11800 [Corallococcus sp. CA054B]|uniref:hypothetical protein n=1 Tax=Corallococcus sp. CA054B TaxID=2316734 RepID=UPI000EA1F25D|nr:hypothetical protein [Corallococcus sp. CA054B]RKG68674.1 hypothetical protein D7V80_11800 [Corallococcus sp. CA054B]